MSAPTGPHRRRYGFAHRGGAAHGPDNVIATFRTAVDRGAPGLETDAWLTGDGTVVLDHDGVLRASLLRRVPYAQVGRDDLPPHVPTLAELYRICGVDVDLAIDVKSVEVAAAVAAVARQHDAIARLWLVAPHPSTLHGVEDAHRAVTVRGTVMRGPRRQSAFRELHHRGIDAVNARWPWWGRPAVAQAHDLGLLAFGYDVQRPAALRRAAALDLDGVFSDHVDRILRVVDR